MPTQIWINTRDGDLYAIDENGKKHTGPLRIKASPDVKNLKVVVVATCGCKEPLTFEPIPEAEAKLLDITDSEGNPQIELADNG